MSEGMCLVCVKVCVLYVSICVRMRVCVPRTRDPHCTAYQRECMSVDVTCRCVCVRRCVCICVRVCVCACVRVHVYVRMGK